ncbi:MAG: hypothetical protein KDA28_07305, partial [Phycisphaerales bacterium]|nr:hypothetical protein [Phycisphaerales bacterium]
DVPRHLLVHDRAMTSTLDAHFGGPISLDVLACTSLESELVRRVLLRTPSSIVELGVIRIHLDRYAAGARRDIEEGRRPLGAIIESCGMTYRSEPLAYFRIENDAVARLFGHEPVAPMYGRFNTLLDGTGACLAEVAEVLPPSCHGDCNTEVDHA